MIILTNYLDRKTGWQKSERILENLEYLVPIISLINSFINDAQWSCYQKVEILVSQVCVDFKWIPNQSTNNLFRLYALSKEFIC